VNQFLQVLFLKSWPWLTAGLGIGLTALGLAWFTGKRLGITSGLSDACSMMTGKTKELDPAGSWKIWFIAGLPVGGYLANAGHWYWTWLYGRVDELSHGSFLFKILWLLMGGFLVGFGARWAGGCTSNHSVMGIGLGQIMSVLSTLAFFTAGVIVANILYKGM
jgi:uncharacterized membrane protein YedE/YeeE